VSVYEEKESYAASRSGGLGGTDVAGVLGLSPWKTPISVWDSKVNPANLPELDKECLRWGTLLEPVVRQEYAARFGVAVTDPSALDSCFRNTKPWNDSKLIIGKEPWMIAAPDGWLNSVNSGLEVKCSARKSGEWGDEGSEEVPTHYYIQASWYMAICEATGWNFGVLFSGNTLQQYRIERDLAFEKDMMSAARAFWHDYVLPGIEPPIDQTTSYGAYLARKFSLGSETIITEPGPEILEWTAKMKLADDQITEAEEEKQLANNHLRALIADAKAAVTPLGRVGWVRGAPRKTVDWKALAAELPIHQAVIDAYTSETPVQPFLRSWWKK